MIDPNLNAKTLITRAWSIATHNKPAVDVNDAAKHIAHQLMKIDDFVDIFVRDYLPEAVLAVARTTTNREPDMIRAGAVVGTREQIKEMVRQELDAGVADWVKRGDKQERVHILDLTKRELLDLADKRSERANKEASRASWYRKIAEKVGDGQTVGDVWTLESLTTLRASIQATVTSATVIPFPQTAVAAD